MNLTVEQCRAARALLDWSAADLAEAAQLGIMTIKRFEGGQAVSPTSLDRIVSTLVSAGVTFIAAGEASPGGNVGVRLA